MDRMQPSPLEGKLEPQCKAMREPLAAAAFSIAISLKRIADRLDDVATGDGAIKVEQTR